MDRRIGLVAAGLLLLAGCEASNGASPTTTTVVATTTIPPIVYPPTNLTVNGFSPGVNEAPFFPTAQVTAVTCTAAAARTVTFTIPAGGAGTAARSAMTAATTVVISPGKAELRDQAGLVLYRETSPALVPAAHGAVVLAMTNTAATDTDHRRVAPGSLNVSGDYLCP